MKSLVQATGDLHQWSNTLYQPKKISMTGAGFADSIQYMTASYVNSQRLESSIDNLLQRSKTYFKFYEYYIKGYYIKVSQYILYL